MNSKEYTDEDIQNAKLYMFDYKSLVESHNNEIGMLGWIKEKLFGTDTYTKIEQELKECHNMKYSEAVSILLNTNNESYIYEEL